MLEKIWQFAILANFPSVATAYTGKLVFCLYIVYTSSLNEMCYIGRLLPPPTHTQQHLLWHSVHSSSFECRSISVRKITLLGKKGAESLQELGTNLSLHCRYMGEFWSCIFGKMIYQCHWCKISAPRVVPSLVCCYTFQVESPEAFLWVAQEWGMRNYSHWLVYSYK